MGIAMGLSSFYALGRWHGEWRYRRVWEAGHTAGYRAAIGDMARDMGKGRQRRCNQRWPQPTPISR